MSENDEAVVHVEVGKVPDLKGLTLKSAIHRVVLAGGVPELDGPGHGGPGRDCGCRTRARRPGPPLEPQAVVKIKVGAP